MEKEMLNTKEVANNSVYEADDHFWFFAPLITEDGGYAWTQAGNLDPVLAEAANGHIAAKEGGAGYALEVRLPWSVFDPFFGEPLVPEDGMVIGFDITFMDIDGDPPQYAAPFGGAFAWSSDFENDNSPSVLGDLIISADSSTSVNPANKFSTMWGHIKDGY